MKKLLPLFILISFFGRVKAQEATCAQKLRLARATYEQGRLHEVEGQLLSCLETGFTKAEKPLKVEGYKLLCLSYIYLEEPEKADQAMLNLKLTDPYYEPDPTVDPAEFVALYNTFRKDPIYRIGAKLGVNASRANISELNAAVELGDGSEVTPGFAIQFGVAADVPIRSRFTLHGDLLYLQNQFEITEKVYRGDDIITGEPLYNEFIGIEKENWLNLPITVEYEFLNPKSNLGKKYKPYVSGGLSTSYLLGAEMTSERTRDDEASIPESGIKLSREKLNLGVIIATGLKLKVASGQLVAELRYTHGLTNVSSQETAFENQRLLWEYGYADPVFKLSSFAATVSYVQDIFKPKKLSRKK